jgi:hypothetical protein
MADELLAQLKSIDPAILTWIVRQDRRDPGLEIHQDWTVEPLSHEKIIDTTAGLFRFRSQDAKGDRPWTVVLKCINNPKQESQQPREYSYWRREIMAFKSGMLEQLPPGVRAPRCYGVMENELPCWTAILPELPMIR